MKFLVFVKQVPRLGDVQFQPGLNRIVREGVRTQVNPLDEEALGLALALRDAAGGEVVAATMGPPQAREVLDVATAAGADRAVLLCDMRFAGADTLATARALARLIELERPDVVLFGRSTIDGGTAQTPAQVADIAGLAFVGDVVDVSVDGGRVVAVQSDGAVQRRWSCPLPVVVSVEAGRPLAGAEATVGDVVEMDADALGGDPAGYGIRGSATYVAAVVEQPTARREDRTDDPHRVLAEVTDAGQPVAAAALPPTARVDATSEIWVVAESEEDAHNAVAREGLAAAHTVAAALDAAVVAVMLGHQDDDDVAALAAAGADRVLVIDCPDRAGRDDAGAVADALAELVTAREPLAVICPWTVRGREYAPRVAARAQVGLTGDFVGLDVAPHPGDDSSLDLVWLKPAWAGTVVARVVGRTRTSMGTLRPGAHAVPTPVATRAVTVERVEVSVATDRPRVELLDQQTSPDAHALAEAPVLLLLGGDCEDEVASMLGDLAVERGWQLGATPALIGRGAVGRAHEVSIARRSFAPRVVVACGVEPADLAPVVAASMIVTVDPDPAAAIHANGDVAAVMKPAALADCVRASAGTASGVPRD